jgi:proteasome lid subunit RPN8/RPN11
VGFILHDGKIVEVPNACDAPDEGFEVTEEALEKYLDQAQATWHTHPGASANLSVGDYHSFLNFPELKHYIVGEDGVMCFVVQDGDLLVAP